MPLSGIILAYVSHGELVYGHIYDPFRDETFSAWKGQGAYMNNKRISCCHTLKLADSVVATVSTTSVLPSSVCILL